MTIKYGLHKKIMTNSPMQARSIQKSWPENRETTIFNILIHGQELKQIKTYQKQLSSRQTCDRSCTTSNIRFIDQILQATKYNAVFYSNGSTISSEPRSIRHQLPSFPNNSCKTTPHKQDDQRRMKEMWPNLAHPTLEENFYSSVQHSSFWT